MLNKPTKYYVYILRCSDNTLYTGITTDLRRRTAEHNGEGNLGSKYTRVRRPVIVVYKKSFKGRAEASKEEARIKKLTRPQKESLCSKK